MLSIYLLGWLPFSCFYFLSGLPRPTPRISSSFPWTASLYVPSLFPHTECNFLQCLSYRHYVPDTAANGCLLKGLKGWKRRLPVSVWSRRSNEECPWSKRVYSMFHHSHTLIYIIPNRNFPGNENRNMQKPKSHVPKNQILHKPLALLRLENQQRPYVNQEEETGCWKKISPEREFKIIPSIFQPKVFYNCLY